VLFEEYQKNDPIETRSDSTPIPAKILPGYPGAVLDVGDSVDAVVNALTSAPLQPHVPLVTKNTAAIVPPEALAGINARIGHFVTHFNPGEVGRTQTVRKAISLIDGHVLAPNAIFSVNNTVGVRTAARGFGVGFVFIDGHLDKQVGGGMCQVATTLYNAALLANQKIVERHQHARTVPYVQPGDDATVWFGEKDFQFQNISGAPIYIYYRTTATHAVCDLYGKADPDTHVDIVVNSKRLGPRYYTGVLKRLVKRDGKTVTDYTSYSEYKWTPALDYNM
jgi:vancomycin resistance protein YoaR